MSQNIQLNASEKLLFRESVKRFLDKAVEPYYEEWESNGIWPRELWNRFGENGFLCVDMPEQYGGYDASFELSSIVVEEISRAGYGSLASAVSVHSDIAAPYNCTWERNSKSSAGCQLWPVAMWWQRLL